MKGERERGERDQGMEGERERGREGEREGWRERERVKKERDEGVNAK